MGNSISVINEAGESVKIDIIGKFFIKEIDREYIMYTLNDDGVSEQVIVLIAQIKTENGKMQLLSIPDEERNLVMVFFDNIRDNACNRR